MVQVVTTCLNPSTSYFVQFMTVKEAVIGPQNILVPYDAHQRHLQCDQKKSPNGYRSCPKMISHEKV